ncbi:MAG TPA: hypothetical protein VN853_23220 [Polyangia bacterium]|nr:hypothetical protein [Polyangia bacterium]
MTSIPQPVGKKRSRLVRFVLVAFVLLGVVLLALAAGASPRRLAPTAVLLAVAAGSGAVALVRSRAENRRRWRFSRSPVPQGIRFSKPWWLYLTGVDVLVHYAALLAALFALFQLPGVGVGILSFVFVVWCLPSPFFHSPRGLTFERMGLRLHHRDFDVLVPWEAVRSCEQIGPDHFAGVRFEIADRERIGDWVSPDTPRNRIRAAKRLAERAAPFWSPWTAGLDAATLVRGIREGIEGRSDRLN